MGKMIRKAGVAALSLVSIPAILLGLLTLHIFDLSKPPIRKKVQIGKKKQLSEKAQTFLYALLLVVMFFSALFLGSWAFAIGAIQVY